ncbi:putative RING-H2 finger protein ATL21A [Senna tora]|uniref:RING-type E3 ubiquitin transferase n=1 Tax=Senna tora TaxID=362788 RepID=A0A834X264_9FABA|nr:putative RING-H2 finger protein ATL21A [Senna tora]
MESERCGYPGNGFEVYCNHKDNKNQTLIYLPNAGEFLVNTIGYYNRKVWINDPDDCLPRRYLNQGTINFSGSPFQLGDNMKLVNFTFLNCSNKDFHGYYPLEPISCLGNGNDDTAVVAMVSEAVPSYPSPPPEVNLSGCRVISNASIPFDEYGYGLYWMGQLFIDIELQWTNPSCSYQNYYNGESNQRKFALGLGLGLPGGMICLIVISYFLYNANMRRRMNPEDQAQDRHHHDDQEAEGIEFINNNNNSRMVNSNNAAVVLVVDTARYPKSKVEDDGGLPNPNDNVCSICLCEYQPKETLRTITDCNHYFHSPCLEDWLKINASCPLCRNLPKNASSSSNYSMSHSSSSSSS